VIEEGARQMATVCTALRYVCPQTVKKPNWQENMLGHEFITPPALEDMFDDLDRVRAACPRPQVAITRKGGSEKLVGKGRRFLAGDTGHPFSEAHRQQSTYSNGKYKTQQHGRSVQGVGSIPPMVMAFVGMVRPDYSASRAQSAAARALHYACVFSRSMMRNSPGTRLILFSDSEELMASFKDQPPDNVTVLLAKSGPPKTVGWKHWRFWCAQQAAT
jgi:hypothetical protein